MSQTILAANRVPINKIALTEFDPHLSGQLDQATHEEQQNHAQAAFHFRRWRESLQAESDARAERRRLEQLIPVERRAA